MTFRDLHPNLKIRFIEMFISNLLGNMIQPFMTIYYAQRFGAANAGLMLMVNVIAAILAGFYGGPLADRLGRRKVLIGAEGLRFTAFLVMAGANSPWLDSPILTFLMSTCISIFWGLSNPANEAMVVDCSTEQNRPLVYSLGYWSWNVSLLLGGIIGGFFFVSYRFEIFLMAAVVSCLSILILILFIQETYVPQKTRIKSNPFMAAFTAYKPVVKDRLFLLFVLAALFNGAIEHMALQYTGVRLAKELQLQTFVSFQGLEFQVDGIKMYGLLTSENALLVAVLGLFIPYLIKKLRERQTLFFGIFAYSLGYGILSAFNIPWVLLAAMFIATAGELIWVPIKQSAVAKLIPHESRSSYLAFYGMTHQVNFLFGSFAVTLGAILPSMAMGLLFFLSGLLSISLFTLVFRKVEKKYEGLVEQSA